MFWKPMGKGNPLSDLDQGQDPPPRPARQVLVVDDSALQRRVLSASLLRWGYDVTEAASGEEALAICEDQVPDLILSDWMMPGMTGLAFCEAFRGRAHDAYTYFILLTAKSDKAEVARGLDAGADDFLIKPVNADELRARLMAGERILQMQRELSETNRLISVTLEELRRVHDSLDRDLLQAKKLQQSLVRQRHANFPQGILSLLLRSSGHVGGDLVGFFPGGKDELGIYGIDVSGHGVSSALMTARLAGYLSGSAPEQNIALSRQNDGSYRLRPPSEAAAALNDLVLDEMDTEHYFTMMLAAVDLRSGRVNLAQAGHPHPLILRADGRIEQQGTGGFPVGLLPGVRFEESQLQLDPGDRLMILSDGVTECPDASGEMLDEAGLAGIVARLRGVQTAAFLEALVWALSEHAGSADFPDDISGAVFEFTGGQPK